MERQPNKPSLADGAHFKVLSALITSDKIRLHLLRKVEALSMPDCWIGAGFVRSAVWDHLHGCPPGRSWDDVDVIWFDRSNATQEVDKKIERQLASEEPTVKWSVKNQARMHSCNGDRPYISTEHAIGQWPETATAVALRLNQDAVDIIAPHGLDDLFSMVLRPTPAFAGEKLPIFRKRVRQKCWLDRWPRLVVTQ